MYTVSMQFLLFSLFGSVEVKCKEEMKTCRDCLSLTGQRRYQRDTVYLDGAIVGIQIARKSMGSRILHPKVYGKDSNTPYIRFMGNRIAVKPLGDSKHYFEATSILESE